ncbi:MAG: aldose epimerase family protein, partial [Acidimicrobiales bacterium]
YVADGRGLPTGRAGVAGTELDFRSARTIGSLVLDTAFTDLTRDDAGRAVVEVTSGSGASRTQLWMDGAFGHVMVFSGDTLADPARRRRGLAVEPMTAPPDMLRSGDGRLVLAPGERFEGRWGIGAT